MDDDCVVLEGTPLAEYLKSLGLEECVEEVEVEEEQVIKNQSQPVFHYLWKFINTIYSAWRTTYINQRYKQLCLSSIIDANIFEEMDISKIMCEHGYKTFSESDLTWCILKQFFQEAVFSSVPAISFGILGKYSMKTKLLALTPTLAVLLRWRSFFPAYAEYKKLLKYLQTTKHFQEDLKVSTRLIYQQCLINKGYVINSRACASAWRLESKNLHDLAKLSQRSLPGLRIAVLQTTSRLAVDSCKELRMQRQLHPLPHNLDHPYLSLPSLNDGDLEEENGDSFPTLERLKKSMDCWLMKQEELMKRVLVSLLSSESDEFYVPISEKLVITVMDSVKQLKAALLLYRTLYCHSSVCRAKPHNESKSMDRLDLFHMMCHSARGHLEEALYGATSMEQFMEDQKTTPVIEENVWFYFYAKVKFHTDASRKCLERASILVSKVESKNVEQFDDFMEENNLNDVFDEEVMEAHHLDVTDQIFEEYGESFHDDTKNDSFGEPSVELDETNSVLVLQELKTVLHAKALDWEERERKLKKTKLICEPVGDRMGKGICEEKVASTMLDHFTDSLSPHNGEKTSYSLSSRVTTSVGEPIELGGFSEEEAGFCSSFIGSLAVEAVAKVKRNRAFGRINGKEDEFIISGDD